MEERQPFSKDGILDESIAREIRDGKWVFAHAGREMGSWHISIYAHEPNRFYGRVCWSDRKNEKLDGTRLNRPGYESHSLDEVPEPIMRAVDFAVSNLTKTRRFACILERAQYNA